MDGWITSYLEAPGAVWVAAADAFIGLAFLAIAINLFRLSRGLRMPFRTAFFAFAFFSFVFGLTSLFEIPGAAALASPPATTFKAFSALMAVAMAVALTSFRPKVEAIAREMELAAEREDRMGRQYGELKRSEERFRLLVDSVKDYAIYLLNPNGIVATWNQGARRLKGYEASEIVGRHYSVFYSEAETHAQAPELELRRASEEGRYESEGWRYRKDGSRFWASLVVTALRDETGQLLGFAKVTRDLSERREAELALLTANQDLEARTRELQKSQAFLGSMIENLPNMVFVKDAEDLRFVRFNKAGEELLGFSREELIGKSDRDFFPPEQAEFFIQKDREVLAGHVIVDIPEEDLQTRLKGKRTLHTRKIPIFSASGKPEYLLGISEDITEWKLAEAERLEIMREQAALEEREKSARRTAFLAEASTLLASSLDTGATIQRLASLAVPALADWCTITMLREDQRLERVAMIHQDPLMNPLVVELNQNYPAEQSCADGILAVIRSGRSSLTASVSEDALAGAAHSDRHLNIMRTLGCTSCMVVPIAAGGRAHGAIALVSSRSDRHFDEHDLTLAEELGRRAAVAIDNALLYQSAQKAIRARDEFLSIASHELKTPITSLKLQLQIARRRVHPEQALTLPADRLAKMLDIATTQVDRLTALIDDLLDVSRIESGKLSFSFEPVDAASFVRDMVDRYREHLNASGCEVSLAVADSAPVLADRFRLEQVILNLLSNSAKYGAGKPIEMSVARVDDRVRIECRDYGMGIPDDKLEKVFERFERAVLSQNISGLGLGLYISREIIKAHHGSIRAESHLGEGARFIVELPTVSAKLAPYQLPPLRVGGIGDSAGRTSS